MGKQRPVRSAQVQGEGLGMARDVCERQPPTCSLWGQQQRPEDAVEGVGSARALLLARRVPCDREGTSPGTCHLHVFLTVGQTVEASPTS